MANFVIEIKAPELAGALEKLAGALIAVSAGTAAGPAVHAVLQEESQGIAKPQAMPKEKVEPKPKKEAKDVTDISDADAVKHVEEKKEYAGRPKEEYAMFNTLKDTACKLMELDRELYETVLYKYVPKGRKYSAIEPKDWGKAIEAFKEAISAVEDISNKPKVEEDPYAKYDEGLYDDEDLITEKVEEDVKEEPKYTLGEVRALSAKAKQAGVAVGAIMKKVANVTKVSLIPSELINTYVDTLKTEMAKA